MVALVNLNEAAHSLNMWDENLVRFGGSGTAGSTAWSYATPSGHSVDMRGLGLQYDAAARPVRGLIKSIEIDAGGAAGQPSEVAITGLVIGAPPLDDSPAAFWDTVLRGATTIDARLQSDAIVGGIPTRLFGDDLVSATSRTPGTTTDRGYDDTLLLGSGGVFAQGDVKLVSGSPNGDFARYVAGDDFIRGAVHTSQTDYAVSGDAFDVGPNASLIGGSDTIRISDSRGIGFATGDAVRASSSFALAVAGVFGGDDRISGFSNSRAELIGDVRIADRGAEVHGGDDLINGSNGSERMAGDIMLDVSRAGNLLICGDDRISGGGGNDVIAGDVFTTVRGVFQAGDDVLSGGFGSDWIFGETASNLLVQVTGGNDQLSGGDGDDSLFGQSGDDILDGGRGADRLDGGVGREVASYASARAGVSADLADAAQNSGAHNGWVRMRSQRRAEQVMCIAYIRHPITDRFVDRILQRLRPRAHRPHFRAEQLHAKHVRFLSRDIHFAHVHYALESQ
jgi:Ca2+-binding RTX toxin-like protein